MTTNAFKNTTMPTNLAAIYARVSSDQQAQEQTIASQVAALRERVAGDGLTLTDELCFLDEGVSGSTLVRPALERLRDLAYPVACRNCTCIRRIDLRGGTLTKCYWSMN